jgi:hypothetical protein
MSINYVKTLDTDAIISMFNSDIYSEINESEYGKDCFDLLGINFKLSIKIKSWILISRVSTIWYETVTKGQDLKL